MTLIELLIALVLLLIMSLALMQTAMLGIFINVQNSMRDEAVNVAEMKMNETRNMPFDSIVSGTDPVEARNFRGFTINYAPTRTIADINVNGVLSKQITIKVDWDYRGKSYTHSVTTILRKQ